MLKAIGLVLMSMHLQGCASFRPVKPYSYSGTKNAMLSYESTDAGFGRDSVAYTFFEYRSGSLCDENYLGTVHLGANTSSGIALPVGAIIGVRVFLESGTFSPTTLSSSSDSLFRVKPEVDYQFSSRREEYDFGSDFYETSSGKKTPIIFMERSSTCP